LLLKDFSFKILDPTFLLLFLIALSSRRQPIVLPDPGSSDSRLMRKSQSFLAKRALGTYANAPNITTSLSGETSRLVDLGKEGTTTSKPPCSMKASDRLGSGGGGVGAKGIADALGKSTFNCTIDIGELGSRPISGSSGKM
jgi:hypothetical protein